MGVYKHVHKGLIVLVPEEIGVWAKLSPESKSKLVLRLLSRELLPVSWYSVENGSPIVINKIRLSDLITEIENGIQQSKEFYIILVFTVSTCNICIYAGAYREKNIQYPFVYNPLFFSVLVFTIC